MPDILVVNGPNMNLLGTREPEHYGTQTLDELNSRLTELGKELGLKLVFFQSNHEGAIIDFIQEQAPNASGMIINAAALSHYSYAIRDAIAAAGIATAEVHMTNVSNREEFRHHSVLTPVCIGSVTGFGYFGYAMALSYFADSAGDQ